MRSCRSARDIKSRDQKHLEHVSRHKAIKQSASEIEKLSKKSFDSLSEKEKDDLLKILLLSHGLIEAD